MTKVMGIINITPDSFSDGGDFLTVDAAVDCAKAMERDGASAVDVGGESTRPGARAVDLDEERGRVIPVIQRLSSVLNIPISVDTYKAIVAIRACEAGASIINDISAGADPEMFDVARHTGNDIILMHMKGSPADMQTNPVYSDVVGEIKDFLLERASKAVSKGVSPGKIWIDPGIGFGKTIEHNYEVLRSLREFTATPYRVLLGASRKSFMRAIERDGMKPKHRIGGSIAAALWASRCGVDMVRVHDVRETAHALSVANHIGVN